MSVKEIKRAGSYIVGLILALLLAPLLFFIAFLCRFCKKSRDVGLGPEPLINNVYHKKALELCGYSAETFVSEVYFITDQFDIRADKLFPANLLLRTLGARWSSRYIYLLRYVYLFVLALRRYRCLYIYFNGGPLGLLGARFGIELLRKMEPFLYKLARVRVVVLPYGNDVQEMSRSPNPLFKHAVAQDYPGHRSRRQTVADQVDRWTKHADHIISGCEWVDYMYHWDTLMLAHFSIDVDLWKPVGQPPAGSSAKLRILHAPNHRAIKGSQYFINAVGELIAEGLDVELVLVEHLPNDEVRKIMASVDIVADQLIIGWYAMFALEAMAMEKPVLCYLRGDLKQLYMVAGLIAPDEIPIINCTPLTVKEVIRDLATNRGKLPEIGRRSREYVIKHHSTQAVGQVFDAINRSIGIRPSSAKV